MKKFKCRFCNRALIHTFVDLGMSPISNDNLASNDLDKMEPFYPLHVYICDNCLLVQLPAYKKREEIFNGSYAYFSSYSDTWLKHCRDYVEYAVSRFKLNPKNYIIELASNDGCLLQYFVEKGIPVLGVEPALNTANIAIKKGIPTIVEFFGVKLAKKLKAEGKKADLLIGNNVFAHVPDLNDFVAGMKITLSESGVITMEFPHLMNLMENNQFDTIYHEHFSYFSYIVVEKVFAKHGLTIFDVQELPTHGGSLRIFARHVENQKLEITPNVSKLREREMTKGFNQLEIYRSFGNKVAETKRKLLEFLVKAKKQGKTIAGYGAPAKGNTLLNYCGIREDFIDYTVDRSPYKQGLYLPGTRIAIFPPEKIRETKPDYVFILPWNIKDEIIEQISYIRNWGGKFLVAIPEVKIIP